MAGDIIEWWEGVREEAEKEKVRSPPPLLRSFPRSRPGVPFGSMRGSMYVDPARACVSWMVEKGRKEEERLTFHQADLSDSCRRSSLLWIEMDLLERDNLIRSSRATLCTVQDQCQSQQSERTRARAGDERQERARAQADLEAERESARWTTNREG